MRTVGPAAARRSAVKHAEAGFMVVLLIVAGILRLHGYAATPGLSANDDEVAWAWAGQSLIENHVPASWSFLPTHASSISTQTSYGHHLPVVKPWLDEPPAFALLIGGSAIAGGQHTFTQVTAKTIRPPVIALSLLSLILVWRVGRRLTGRGPALVATALLAVAPPVVLASRVVESEALLAPLLLAIILLLHRILGREARRSDYIALVVLCAVAPLVKVPGITFGLIAAVPLFTYGHWRSALWAMGGAAAGGIVFVGYGALLGWNAFLSTIDVQGSRRQGVEGAFQFITSTSGGWSDKIPVHDAWWLLGWIAAGSLLAVSHRSKRMLLLAWPLIAYAAALSILAAPQNADRYGWYRLAVYPLAYLLAAQFAWTTMRRPSLASVALLLCTAGALTFNYFGAGSLVTDRANGLGGGEAAPPTLVLLALAALVAVPVALSMWPNHRNRARRTARWAVGLALSSIIVAATLSSWRLADIATQL